jgi:outer membrane protein insertion porin family
VQGGYEQQDLSYEEAKNVFVEFNSERRVRWPDNNFFVNGAYHIGYQKSYYQTNIVVPGVIQQTKGILSRLTLGVRRYDLDKPLFPTRGSLFSTSIQIGGLGGDYKFVKGRVKYEWYFPLFWKFVLNTQANFGVLGKLGNKPMKVDISDLFAAGGVYAVDGVIRGYNEAEFGRYRGNGLAMLAFTGQIYFPILENQLYLGGFADIGNVWDDMADIDLKDMFPGVGVGFRLQLPMLGLIGFDLAWGLRDPANLHFGKRYSEIVPHFILQRGF